METSYAYMLICFCLLLGFNIGAVVAYFVVTRILLSKVSVTSIPYVPTDNLSRSGKEEVRITGAAIQRSSTGTQANARAEARI